MENIEIAKSLIKLFNDNNERIYLVGGSVRDYLIYGDFDDFDFATPCIPSRVKEILNITNNDEFSEKFGTVKTNYNGVNVEITAFRKERYEGKSRHPIVEFIDDIKIDYLRRDFTINSIYLDNDDIYYLNNSKNDFENKIIDTNIDPVISFNLDPLRILRCVRFAKTLDLKVNLRVLDAIEKCKNNLNYLSSEKVKEEITKFEKRLSKQEIINAYKEFDIFDIVGPKML